MLNNSKLDYTLHYDNGMPICLVGTTELNKEVYGVLKFQRECEIISIEDFATQSKNFYNEHQYFTASGNTAFKISIINDILRLNENANFISLVSNKAVVHQDATIGKGSLVCPTAYIGGPSLLGNFVILQHYCQIGHSKSTLSDHCYISPMSTVVDCKLAEGTWIGLYSNFSYVETVPYQQFQMYSRVRKTKFEQSGTYRHDRLVDPRNCLENYIA